MDHPYTLHTDTVKAEARRLGFSACGLAPAEALPEAAARRYREWLSAGCHADMEYLARNVEKRLDPRLLVPGAKTVVSLALNYYTQDRLSADGYRIARYALGRDYHDVMRRRLAELAAALGLRLPEEGRAFCDTAPVAERYWAERCGIGRTGLNGQFFLADGGSSYCFLGELILTLPADHYDRPLPDSPCTDCGRCLRACPTAALRGDGTLDARRCLSYLTIEHRGPLPPEAATRLGDCIYGCDRCAEACPLNARPAVTAETDFFPSPSLKEMTREAWHTLTVEQYRELLRGAAGKRAKYEGWQRNIAAAGSAPTAPQPSKTKYYAENLGD